MSMPIPNDDPDCHCAIADGNAEVPAGVTAVTGGVPDQEARLLLHLDCPHHGPAVRAMTKGTLGAMSLGKPGR
jgi:hypothetical protein